MSLVNEALKRAQEVQNEDPPRAPSLQFHPIEPGHYPRDPWVHLVPAVLAIIGVVVVLLAWRLVIQKPPREGFEVQALAAQAQPVPVAPITIPAPSPIDPAPVASRVPIAPAPSQFAALPEAISPVKPVPPLLKLQAIFYHPSSPSAIISGKTIYRGDTIGELQVTSIDSHTVTLTSTSKTNQLTLPD
jgi:hypothetical protein